MQKGDCAIMSEEVKKLGPEGVGELWQKVFELVKLLTGDVDTSKGTLQEQINEITSGGASGGGVDTSTIEEALWQGYITANCALSDDSELVTSAGENIMLTKTL